MQEHHVERLHPVHRVQAEHHHPGHPEEQDVVPGDQHAGRVEPARGPRSSSGQPRVENGHSADENQVSSTSSSCRQPSPVGGCVVRADADGLAVRPVPDRDPVPPPQLARDAPVVHVVDPGEVPLGQLVRLDHDPTVADRVAGRLGQRPGLHEPLQAQPRLDRGPAARAVTDRVHVRPLLGHDPALLAQRGDDGRTRLVPVQALVRPVRGDDAALVHDGQARQVVPLADLEVVGVVRRGHLDRAGTRTPGRRARRPRSGCAGRSAAAPPRCRPGAGSARRPGAPRPRCRPASSRPGWSPPRSRRRRRRTGSRRARPRPRCAPPRCRTARSGSAGTS